MINTEYEPFSIIPSSPSSRSCTELFKMDDSTDTESIDMSVEELSPSGPKSSIPSGGSNLSTTPLHGSFSVGTYMNSIRDNSPTHEHNISLHSSFGVEACVSKTRSYSPSSQHQHALAIRGHSCTGSGNGSSLASLHSISAQDSTEHQQDIHPSRLHMLHESHSFSESVKVNTISILSSQSPALTKRALSPDAETCKRRKLSFSSSDTIKNDLEPCILIDTNTSSNTCTQSTLIVSDEYIEDFLDSLSGHIYKSVLENLCPDNMRGSFCRTPDVCFNQGSFFACPNFATLRRCKHGEHALFAHSGHKHTLRSCQVNDKVECKRIHPDGHPCRVKVIYFHVRAACVTLRGGTYCQKEPCEWGHDHKDIRRKVMLIKKPTCSEKDA